MKLLNWQERHELKAADLWGRSGVLFRAQAADHKWTNIPEVIRPRQSLAASGNDNFQEIQALTRFSLDFGGTPPRH